jgi:amino acid transporter
MPATRGRKPRLILVPIRALLVTFLITLLSFAISLLLGIVGIAIYSRIQGIGPNLTLAYRNIAAPCAIVVGVIVFVLSLIMEVRHYRQAKALASIEKAG